MTGWSSARRSSLGRPRSLRARLAIAYTGIVTVLVVIVLVATHAIVEQALIDGTAARLEIEAGLIASQSTAGRGVTATDLAAGELAGVLGGQQTGVVILDGEGRLLASQANGAPMTVVEARLASGDYATIASTGMSTTSVVPTDAGDVLVIAVPVRLRSGNGPPAGHGRPADKGPPPGRGLGNQGDPATASDEPANAVAQLAVSLAPVRATLANLRDLLLIIGAALVAASVAVASLITSIGLRPLARIAGAADRVSAGDLDARANLADGQDEIARVGAAFDAMVERVETTLRSQRQFAADASHELRSPLTVLGGFVDVLARGELGTTQAGARTLSAMRAEVDRLSRLATDLLLLSQIEAGGASFEPRPLDLAELLDDVGRAARVTAGPRQIVVAGDRPLVIVADRDRLTQAVMNLVDNAIRHTPDGRRIELSSRRSGNAALLTVTNEGADIDARHLPHLFDRFYRVARADADEQPGQHAGLGLPIVKAIAEASGGSVRAASADGLTTFELRLPLHRGSALVEEPSPRRAPIVGKEGVEPSRPLRDTGS